MMMKKKNFTILTGIRLFLLERFIVFTVFVIAEQTLSDQYEGLLNV